MIALKTFFKLERDSFCLITALILLLSAVLFDPTFTLKQEIRSYFFVVDISQSMNVEDVRADWKTVSRLTYTRELLHEVVARLPCNSYVSIGLYAGAGVAALYSPLEVCKSYSVIHDTISHIDWKQAWTANSRIRESLGSLATVTRSFPEASNPVLFTDGEEAPRLHTFNTKDLRNFQGGDGWLFVGIGGQTGTPIPKYTEGNQRIGYWSEESFATQPGISQISEGNMGARDDSVALNESERYLSRLDEKYLISLAREINADYIRGSHIEDVVRAMEKQKPSRLTAAPFKLNQLLAAIAGLSLLLMYLPTAALAFRNKVSLEYLDRNAI
jgi:mxaL protein